MEVCLTVEPEVWFENNCTEVSKTKDQAFFDQLFNLFYQGESGVKLNSELDFQNLLIDVCNLPENGGKCKSNWARQCEVYQRSELENLSVQRTCACYLPDSEYQNQQGAQEFPRACDPFCAKNRINGVNFFESSDSVTPETCQTNICLIDNVTVEAINSDLGQIQFGELCGGCGGTGNCRCIISDINLLVNNSKLDQIDFINDCPGGAICFAKDQDGQNQEVPCESYFQEFNQKAETRRRNLLIIIVVIILIIIILVIYLANVQRTSASLAV